jgi:hypothetical protein
MENIFQFENSLQNSNVKPHMGGLEVPHGSFLVGYMVITMILIEKLSGDMVSCVNMQLT